MGEAFATWGRRASIAAMHGKERVIDPILSRSLGLVGSPAAGIDTDKFGTFSREIERQAGQRETARAKALAAPLLEAKAGLSRVLSI